MRIIITGSNGLVGSEILNQMLTAYNQEPSEIFLRSVQQLKIDSQLRNKIKATRYKFLAEVLMKS